MPLYFAYGSNMDVEAMRLRCPRSTPLGVARLARHRFFIMQGGYASVMRDPRREVHGVLWDLALSDVRTLDAYEDVRSGLYRKVVQPVLRGQGASARALVYVGGSVAPAPPLPGYMESVLSAARAWDFPETYLRELAAFAPGAGRPGAAAAWRAPDGTEQVAGVAVERPKVRPRFASPLDRGRE
ncbi:MAG: gamma-glutamylcyclotransferase [Hyphomicrobiales bacterium]|nr:gamma-glutamylcyclotransferase [Hyphomicrobiales bacterium]